MAQPHLHIPDPTIHQTVDSSNAAFSHEVLCLSNQLKFLIFLMGNADQMSYGRHCCSSNRQTNLFVDIASCVFASGLTKLATPSSFLKDRETHNLLK